MEEKSKVEDLEKVIDDLMDVIAKKFKIYKFLDWLVVKIDKHIK